MKIRRNKRKNGTRIFWTIMVGFLAITSASRMVAYSKEKGKTEIDQKYYIELESEYLKRSRAYLEELGYRNCGVNLTRTIDADGQRSYQVCIHHRNFNRLQEGDQEKLLNNLEALAYADESAAIHYQIF